MKTIEPVSVWYNGQEKQATVLSASASGDNLSTSASFVYQLMIQPSEVENPITGLFPVAQGYLNMTGEVYQAWETNDYAYDWVAAQLNLTITGDYVPPVPPQPEPTPEPEPIVNEE
jgi:hypothetical protein